MSSNTPPPTQGPPAYTEADPRSGSGQSLPELPTAGPQPAHHASFGPTPLTTQPLIPYAYYDARSPYSVAQADMRARWRLIGALLWGFGLWAVIGLLVGVEVVEYDITRVGITGLWGNSHL
jgi:hypothetical protein